MTDLQEVILSTYKIFKGICDRNNLKFYAYAGTAIGAVRHNGFIPWDDDIDIVMPCDDYTKLITILEKNTPESIGIFNGLQEKTSDMAFLRMFDKSTMFTSYDLILDPKSFIGVYIDIFPFIGTPNEPENQEIFKRSVFKNLSDLREAKLFTGRSKSVKKLKEQYNTFFNQYPISESTNVCILDRILLEKNIPLFAADDFKEQIEYPFEDTTIYLPNGYDKQLRKMFGNYMKPPKISERVSHHSPYALIDLSNSYESYQKLFTNTLSSTYVKTITKYALSLRSEKEDIVSRIPPLENRIREESLRADKAEEILHKNEVTIKQSVKILVNAVKRRRSR